MAGLGKCALKQQTAAPLPITGKTTKLPGENAYAMIRASWGMDTHFIPFCKKYAMKGILEGIFLLDFHWQSYKMPPILCMRIVPDFLYALACGYLFFCEWDRVYVSAGATRHDRRGIHAAIAFRIFGYILWFPINCIRREKMERAKYAFTWDLIGDISARENLGPYTRVEVYRLMQYCLRDILEHRYDTETADTLFREAGRLAGEQFYTKFLTGQQKFTDFVSTLQGLLKDMGIGILRIEGGELADGGLVLTVSEDLDCSGLPELDYEFCAYDEGFISGILSKYTGKHVAVRETDCWCTGDRTCRFSAKFS